MKKILLLIFIFSTLVYSQADHPKREFRSAWVASVTNLDWPISPNNSTEVQKQNLIQILDSLKSSNFNVVIFQIRPECDALYDSPYEPWSYWLTGSQGTPPSPFYDPLSFAIEEVHKRGMEIHAWFNPYRAVKTIGNYTNSSDHITNTHPEWILNFSSIKILDPGIPDVREYNLNIIMDVVNRYDIDGVHMDDYFYPYPPDQISNQDAATYQQYGSGFTNIGNWRRWNVNRQMEMIMDSINVVKPHVKFGISPFGIWKNGVPSGITGMDAYNVIYADPIAWLHEGSVDYLTPQLYWQIGGPQDYFALATWWADSADYYNRHLYPGHIFRAGYSNNELPAQLRIDRNNDKIKGSVFFRAANLKVNTYGFQDSLRTNYYLYKALPPVMGWKDTVKPAPVENLRFDRLDGMDIAGLVWDNSNAAADGDSSYRFAIYKFTQSSVNPGDIEDASKLYLVTEDKYNTLDAVVKSADNKFVVTGLDRNYNESEFTTVVSVTAPETPALIAPADNTVDVADVVKLEWGYANPAASYILEVAEDVNFDNIFKTVTGIKALSYDLTAMEGQTTYYWRVKGTNPAGDGEYSSPYSFTTGFPVSPLLVTPENNTGGYALNLDFVWNASLAAESYRVQVARAADFISGSIIIDSSGVADTTLNASLVDGNSFHFWRVKASNTLGMSEWSDIYRFKTGVVSVEELEPGVPENFTLSQNYPNPFNPTTMIKFGIPESGFVMMNIYNILGEIVLQPVNGNFNAGTYSVEIDGSDLPSGMYIYTLRTSSTSITKKMMLLK